MESVAVNALRMEQELRGTNDSSEQLAGERLSSWKQLLPGDSTNAPKQSFEGGATRTVKLERYDLIPPEAEAALARRFGLGAQRHGEGNWKHGGVEFVKATINHMKAHMGTFLMNDPQGDNDDDLGAILWGAAALCWFRRHKSSEYLTALHELQFGKVTAPSEQQGHCAK